MEAVIWKKISGYENLYEVNNLGEVKSLRSNKILKTCNVGPGYPAVSLCKDGTQKTAQIHRLVMEAFCPTDNPKLNVNHKDLNKENNRLDNLEWVTREENMRHASRNGRIFGATGEKHPFTTLKEHEVREMRQLFKKGKTRREISELFNTNYATVRDIIAGKSWKYLED